jgi:hypothetical protein
LQFDGPPAGLTVSWQPWEQTESGAWQPDYDVVTRTYTSVGDTPSLALSGACCESVQDSGTYECRDPVEILVVLMNDGFNTIAYTSTGPRGGASWSEWTGPAPTCP